MISLTELTARIGEASIGTALIDHFAKATILLLVAWGVSLLLRRSSAAARHQMWTAALLAVLALPVLSMLLPTWRVPVFSAPVGAEFAEPSRSAEESIELTPPAAESHVSDVEVGGVDGAAPRLGGPAEVGEAERWQLLPLLWAFGALLLLSRLLVAAIGAWKVVRESAPVTDADLVAAVGPLCRQLGMHCEVALVEHPRITMPMAWGVLQQTVLLPPAARTWTEARRRVVLLHELAHLKRWDCQTLLLARVVTALHWFNPLAWLALRRLQAEREHACDDLVLTSGTPGADYAQHLLDVARALHSSLSPGWAMVAMARPSELEGRLLAILDPNVDRGQTRRIARLGGVSVIACLVIPLASLQPRAGAAGVPSEGNTAPVKGAESPIDADLIEAYSVVLRDEDSEVRAQAAHSLGSIEDAAAVPLLEKILHDDASEGVRQQAAWALGMIRSEDAVPALQAALSDPTAGVRQQAAWALGMIESDAAVPELRTVLSDGDASVRQQAAQALGKIQSDAAVPEVLTALSDGDASVRRQAAWALGMIENEAACEALGTALGGDEAAEVRAAAAWALGRIESPSAVGSLTAALAADTSAEVRVRAAWALGTIEDEAALDALLDAMSDDHVEVRKRALQAIGQISR